MNVLLSSWLLLLLGALSPLQCSLSPSLPFLFKEANSSFLCIRTLGFPNYGYFPAAPGVPTPGSTSNAERANMAAVAAASGYYDYSAAQVRHQLSHLLTFLIILVLIFNFPNMEEFFSFSLVFKNILGKLLAFTLPCHIRVKF